MASPGSGNENYTQQFEVITSQARIASLLRPLLQKHSLLTATLADSRQYYNTVLLEVDPDNRFLMLDELHPVEGHRLTGANKTLTLYCQLDGVNLNFSVPILEIGSANNVAFYKTGFPDSIRYQQRRNDYRVSVSSAHSIPVELASRANESVEGELHDISAGGMCMRFPRKSSLPFDKNDEALQCSFKLVDGKTIHSTFRICHVALVEATNTLLVGGCFQQLDKAQHRAVERYVIELQRKSRQKDAR